MLRHSYARKLVLVAAGVTIGCDGKPTLVSIPPTLALSSTLITPITTIGGAPVTTRVTIINGTEGTLEGLTTTIRYLGTGAGWLTSSLDRTTATQEQAATLELRATPGSLGLGLYLAEVQVAAVEAANGPITIQVRLTIDPRPPAKILIVTQPATQAVNGATLTRQPVVQLLNAIDEPALRAGVIITAAVGSGGGQTSGGTTAITGPDGRATFSGLALLGTVGAKTLTFSATGLTPTTSGQVTVAAGPAARLEALTALTQSANAGTAAGQPPRVRVVDQSGNPVGGTTVGFNASAGSVLTPGGPLPSGADGTAGPTSWVLNPVAGANSVVAAADGLTGSPITFTATGQVGPASQLIKLSGDNAIGLIGTTLGTPHVVKLADQFGNGVDGVTVSWVAVGGGGVTPAQAVTAGGGLTQATRSLPGTAGSLSTTATATINGAPTSVSFAVTAANAGPAQIVKIQGDTQTGVVNSTLPVAIQVQVLDAVGTPQPNVTVSFTTPNGGSFPSGATAQTNAQGFASTTWQLGTGSGPQTAQAAVGGPAPAVFSATATPGPLAIAQSTIASSPGTIPAGGSSTITVTARDGFGNPISGLAVTLSMVSGAATLTQPTATTNAAGQAAGSVTATVAGSKLVTGSIAGAPLGANTTVLVVPGAPASIVALSLTTITGVRFGQAVATRPSVQVRDAFGNGVPNVSVSFAITSGQSTVSPTSRATDGTGTVTVDSWTIAPLFTGPNEDDVYNRLIATAAGGGIGGNPITFTGTTTISFAADMVPLLQSCGSCHDGNPSPDWAFTTPAQIYTNLITSVPAQYFVIPGDSVSNVGATRNLMTFWPASPTHTGQTTNKIATIIKAWIRQGAPNN